MSKKQTTVTEDGDTQRRTQAMSDYKDQLAAVEQMKELTDCAAWKELYSAIMGEIEHHGKLVLDAEKPREVVQHQEGVKILRRLIDKIKNPVDELNRFIAAMPLFSTDMTTRAEWNEALGRIELVNTKR